MNSRKQRANRNVRKRTKRTKRTDAKKLMLMLLAAAIAFALAPATVSASGYGEAAGADNPRTTVSHDLSTATSDNCKTIFSHDLLTTISDNHNASTSDDPNTTAIEYTVTFNAGYTWPSGKNIPRNIGDIYTLVSKTCTSDVGTTTRVGDLPVKYRLGHVMTGWYTKKKGGSKISSRTIITKDVTYYAHWKKASASQIAKYIAKQAKKKKKAAARVQAATDAVTVFVAMNKYYQGGKYYNKPEGVFVKGISTCAGEVRALGMVMKKMGYKWEHINANKNKHQWVVVYTKKNRKGAMWADANYIGIDYANPPDYFHGLTGKGKKSPLG